ncbi:type III secretion system needle length determinant [Halopseudomonas xinjiangensis]|uniref:Type III secretion system needle length determinant n=1 Tax=Halopseudomonas xinjiangensis TaxID=487184 RepID=A0A1H1YQY9_9GAMM|nr:flagellar hook-length control protein FliK [Halopseudomonas xinjiangensis]SDT23752.1 type III secretion system needle length determinant [Halopseudomonas xinjiangensis]
MIHLMTPAGTGADRLETVRSAKLMGGDAAPSGRAEQLGMHDILAMLDTLHGAQGEPVQLPAGGDGDAQAEQSQAEPAVLPAQPNIDRSWQPGWGAQASLPAAAGRDRPVTSGEALPTAESVLDRASFGVAQSADQRTGDLPLQQIEQWLGELQDLRRRHAAPGEQTEEPMRGVSGGHAGMPEPLRFTQQQDSIRMQAQWSNLTEPRGFNMPLEQDVATGSRLATAAVTMDDALLSTVMDEPALQAVTSRTSETLSSVHPGAPTQPVTGQAPVPAEIRLQGSEARWGEQMLQALRDQVEMQLAQRSQHATIRLDPPDLGSLDIQINHEQGKLSIQINAGQADVARLLNMLSERLRHELLGQNFSEVTVQIGGNADQGRERRQRQADDAGPESIAAARVIESARTDSNRDPAGDVLISV